MEKESNALIRLTKSEIEYVIISLLHSMTSAEYFQTTDNYALKMFDKLKKDFTKIKDSLEDLESDETINTTGAEVIAGRQAGEECD